ncbi:glycerophosphodiester phosphodiesterase [Burkholderia sp. Leaf177]|uniref:glycerophosphodiester phosphodiesterase family protein n=1 Tax=Burkholderia sp. Leaf177 TaxID=1736287 RepID=UPI0006F70A20|nr:glycerophosphodiester phosphodiesterase family protein [Burkholderia sp. Leaf177]KQR73806.1 glycerophosphodiester phosphodiesterase [Burkholderia sp. Leaf177]
MTSGIFRILNAASLCMLVALPATSAFADPLIIAHRGGTGDTPENTLLAFRTALDNGADALWMTVQVTKDRVPVLYRPGDLGALTEAHGRIDEFTLGDIEQLNAGYSFEVKDASGQINYPYRDKRLRIPTLREALQAVPANVPIMLDMKQTPAAPLVAAVARILDESNAWSRVRLYSTDAEAIQLMKAYPKAQVFETRDATRDRLLDLSLGGTCDNPPPAGSWVGIELHRQVEVIERFTLGTGVSKVDAKWWTPAAVKCFKTNGDVKIVAFGVDSAEAYATASKLGIDAVMTDSPRAMRNRQ